MYRIQIAVKLAMGKLQAIRDLTGESQEIESVLCSAWQRSVEHSGQDLFLEILQWDQDGFTEISTLPIDLRMLVQQRREPGELIILDKAIHLKGDGYWQLSNAGLCQLSLTELAKMPNLPRWITMITTSQSKGQHPNLNGVVWTCKPKMPEDTTS